jgi:lactoylglutathione lyase
MALLASAIVGMRRVSLDIIIGGMSVDPLKERGMGRSRVVGQGEPCRTQADHPGQTLPPSDMGLRLELFVEDIGASIDFYTKVLGFEVLREHPGDYASLRCGDVTLGIGPISKLPKGVGYFTREIASLRRGLGVEIVLEIDEVDEWYRHVSGSGHPVFEPPQDRPWGLKDFRIIDPDGYYLRLTSKA